ncbi:hypothetical protein Asru_0037_05 [Acidisphaera rubrifaciens HS-AP3]|uniref:SnoaL-like domain-containing protein n=1 Tax=Acidisphaera rubrifaciens HS-AP3 TaxID=1231350 RepID=A0A0D6P453_9PROT|nr:hypothetical protein Asru_0037_05 [Acidisphaera rubrifaciens HS-AP3]
MPIDRRRLLGAVAAAPLLVGAAPDEAPARAVGEAFARTLSAHDLAAFAALFAPDYVNHQRSAAARPPLPGMSGRAIVVALFADRLRALPDLTVTVEHLLPGADGVAASYVYEGTQRGAYLGQPATGRRLRFTSCDIFRLRGGLIVEHWGMSDTAGALAQMRAG